jgi:hypothetical protein
VSPFTPGDPWPDTTFAGGAIHEAWSGYIRFFLQAQIAAGTPFTLGPHQYDQLTKGNVLSQPGGLPADLERSGGAQLSGLWVDLTCDLLDCEISAGASSQAGVLSKVEAGTLTATLYDPTGAYDPLNPSSPYALNRQTRLIPGVPLRAFCEVINDVGGTPSANSARRFPLFTGTADSWQEQWVNYEGERFAKVVATDTAKVFTKMDRPEQPAQGAGELVANRLTRIVNYFAWGGTVAQGLPYTNSGQALGATTLAQSAWELVNRAIDDELGFAYFLPVPPSADFTPKLRWYNRDVWQYKGGPKITIGCGGDPADTFDIAVDAQPASFDSLLTNAVYAARSGGTQQTVTNQTSIDRFGEASINRSDLGLNTDAQVALWAQLLVNGRAYPQTSLDHITLVPAAAERPWQAWQQLMLVEMPTSVIRVLYDRIGYEADLSFRVVGMKHAITPDAWEVTWQTVTVTTVPASQLFHIGQHPQDNLNYGFQVG